MATSSEQILLDAGLSVGEVATLSAQGQTELIASALVGDEGGAFGPSATETQQTAVAPTQQFISEENQQIIDSPFIAPPPPAPSGGGLSVQSDPGGVIGEQAGTGEGDAQVTLTNEQKTEILLDIADQFNAGTIADLAGVRAAIIKAYGDAGITLSEGEITNELNLVRPQLTRELAPGGTGGTDIETPQTGGTETQAGGGTANIPIIPSPDSVVATGLGGSVQDRLDRLFEQSATRGGRGDIFSAFSAAQGGTPLQRSARQSSFNPLSAAFALRQANDPSFGNIGTGDVIGPNLNSFRDFLGGNPQRLTAEELMSGFKSFAPLFGSGQLSELDEARRDFVSNAGQNLATEFLSSRVNPLFRGSIGSSVGRRFDASKDLDPLGQPFAGFLTRQGF